MFSWLTKRFKKPKESVKNLFGVQVTVKEIDGQWAALFRAWDRGMKDGTGAPVPERAAILGADPSDVLKKAQSYIRDLQQDEVAFLPQSMWPADSYIADSDSPIRNVMVFPDGLCTVFDAAGNQLSQYEGPWQDVGAKIIQDAPDDAEFEVASKIAAADLRRAARSWKLDVRV